MNYSLQYMRIEIKRAARAFMSGLISLIIISLITIGSAAALFVLLQSLGVSEPIKVAIASEDEEAVPQMALRLMEGMDSVKSVCEFEMTDVSTARNGVSDGTYGAAVLLPYDFYNDVNTGINTPAVVLIPEDMTGGIRNFGELIETGVSFIDTVEGGIYAVTDAYLVYDVKVSRTDMENYLTSLSFDILLKRTKIFNEEFDSSFDTGGLISYYMVCALLLIILFSCTGFGYLYSRRSSAVEYNFRRVGLGPVKTGFVKFFIMFVQLSAVSFLYCLAVAVMRNIFLKSENELLSGLGMQLDNASGTLGNVLYILPVILCICGFAHMFFSLLKGREDAGLLLLIVFIVMLVLGGCVVPQVFLPDVAAKAGNYLPAAMWRNDIFAGGVLREIMLGILFFGTGEVLSWAYTS